MKLIRSSKMCPAAVLAVVVLVSLAPAAPAAPAAPPVSQTSSPQTVYRDLLTDVGLLGLNLTNLGYFGNAFANRNQPSGEYPLNSNVEHIYRGGLWVGGRAPDGTVRVSTSAQDANGQQEGDDNREFANFYPGHPSDDPDNPSWGDTVKIWSNSQNSTNYNIDAKATKHIEVFFTDFITSETGNHQPLDVRVRLRALA